MEALDREKASKLGQNLLSAFFESRGQDMEADAEQLQLYLSNLLKRGGIANLEITAEVKQLDSALEKVERKCRNLTSDYADKILSGHPPETILTDLVRARIVCNFSDQIDVIQKLLQDGFEVDAENTIDHRSPSTAGTFGYAAMHIVCQPVSHGPTKVFFTDCKFEIQIRSRLMDLWGVVNWDFEYKPENEIPYEISRRLSSVAALFYLIDREFIALRKDLSNTQQKGLEENDTNSLALAVEVIEQLSKRGILLTQDEIIKIGSIRKQLPNLLKDEKALLSSIMIDRISLFLLDKIRFKWMLDNQTAYDMSKLEVGNL